MNRSTRGSRVGPIAGGIAGGSFFWWIAGTRIIDPTQFEWLMKLDWRINFLGWHLFRNDPWRLPPGIVEGYLAGEGTTVGFTDSVPLAALLLKPFDAWLPTPFQYFGLWLLLCFVLQGVFGALLVRAFTGRTLLQALGAALFVLIPTLLMRVGHPALTAHFFLLWALWLSFGRDPAQKPSVSAHALLGLAVGLTHPYLAAMTLLLLGGAVLSHRTTAAAHAFAGAVLATLAGWWLGGFLSVSSTTDLAAGGLGLYSMNLLSPLTPRGWSSLLPEVPVAHELQAYEGYQYLGAGVMVLLVVALVLTASTMRSGSVTRTRIWPVAMVCTACAIYALSPRITVGDSVLIDWSHPVIDRLAFFRASGRFFWPMTYLLLTAALGVVVTRLRTWVAALVVAVALVIQIVDLRPGHGERRFTSRSEAFHAWPRQLNAATWGTVLSYYDHISLVPASQCGGAPLEHEELAFLAGMHGLTINSGLGARWDESRRRRYCGALEAAITEGRIEPGTIYIVSRAHEQRLHAAAGERVVCGSLDSARVCVSSKSYETWPDTVRLSE
jgi:hypothetical protein